MEKNLEKKLERGLENSFEKNYEDGFGNAKCNRKKKFSEFIFQKLLFKIQNLSFEYPKPSKHKLNAIMLQLSSKPKCLTYTSKV